MSDQAAQNGDELGKKQRHMLAMSVFWLSTVSIIILAGIGIKWGTDGPFDKIFAALVPLFGTWVGTILAFYFSRENFEAANKSLQQVVKQLTPDEQLKSIPIKSAMIPKDKMVVVTLPSGGAAAVGFDTLQGLLKPPVTRIPVLSATGSAEYVIHESLIYKYIAKNSTAGFDASKHSLATLVADRDIAPMVKLFAVVGDGGTLADAKAAMEKVQGAQDVFVTSNGQLTGAVTGWLTNVEMTKKLDARATS